MKITLKNFRCFKYKELEFPNGNLSLLKGESGKGKSTVLEGIRWCLFSGLRNIYPMNFKPSSTNQTIVTLEFPKMKLFRIERSQPPEQLTVYIRRDSPDGTLSEDFDILDSEAAQRYIESVFSSKDIWYASSYISQGDRCPLMTYSNTEKMNLLSSILFGDKFNSDVNTYDNPDFYTSRIDKDLSEVSSKLTLETANFNNLYGKYMELINNYKPRENPYWKALPTEDKIKELENEVGKLKTSISEITKTMLEIKGKEKEKEFLSQRLQELKEKISLFESMNSSDMVTYLQNTRIEISSLETSIQEMNTLYLSILAKEQQKEFLTKKVEDLHTNISSYSEEVKNSATESNLQETISSLKNEKSLLESEKMKVEMNNFEKERLEKKKDVILSELNSVNEKLSSYSNLNIEELRLLISNTKSFQKLKDIQEKEPENINFVYNDDQILEMSRKLPSYIETYKFNYTILRQFNLLQENQPITDQTEQTIFQHLASVQKVLDFTDIMKKELEFKEKHKINDAKRKYIEDDISVLKNKILEEEKELSEIPILNLETYITMKTEIHMNIGDALQCPDCNTSLEMNHTSSGAKLCKITKPKFSKEEGKHRIDLLSKLSESLKCVKVKETELEFLQKEKEGIPIPKPEYTSDQIVNTYTPEAISKYKNFYDNVSKVRHVKNEFCDTDTKAEELLRKIPIVQRRRNWEREFTQAKQNLSIDSSLQILSFDEIFKYERDIIDIPILISKRKQLEDSYKEVSESLDKILEVLKDSKHIEEIVVKIQNLKEHILSSESLYQKKIEYNKFFEEYTSLKYELQKIVIHTSANEVNDSLQSLRTKSQNLKETLSGYSQYEVLTEEYRTIDTKIMNIILTETSEELSKKLDEINEKIVKLEDYTNEGKTILQMATTRVSLEIAQKSMLELTTQQSILNRMRMLILEVTNSSLQNLVDAINECTNSVLEELFENDIKVELKLFKEQKKTNNLKPQVNFTIYYNNNIYDNIVGLSGGEKDRISLALTVALACVNPSPVLFLDECLSTVGNDLRECAIDALKKYIISQTGKTCVLVQHSMIEGYCDYVTEI
jgi:DNA repair exonuclease SbcCD ATPase subunit